MKESTETRRVRGVDEVSRKPETVSLQCVPEGYGDVGLSCANVLNGLDVLR